MNEIELGDKVKCKYTGFTGIAVARTEFVNGCVQYAVAPKWDGKGLGIEEIQIDEQSLLIVKPVKKEIKKDEGGGRNRLAFKQRGF